MNPKKDFNLLGNINKGYTKMPEEDTLYIPITEEDGYVLQKFIISEIDRSRSMGFTRIKDVLSRINLALQHSLAAAQDKGE